MASLRDVVSEYQDDLRNGIAWLAFWREGRSWQAEAFHLDLDDTLYPEDRARLAEIQAADPRAIVVNGYYSGYLSEEMSVAELAAGVRHHYDNGLNNIALFMEAHSDELPPDVLEAAREKAHAAGLPFYERPYRGDDIDPYSYDGHMSIEDYELMQKLMEQDRERSEPMSEVFSILLHNRQRYEQGKEGLWFSLPATTEKLQEALREIGISADNPQDFFLYDYRSPQERPIKLPRDLVLSADVDELNFLAARLEKLDAAELSELNAALTSPQSDFHSIGQIIDYPDNVDYYVHLPDVTGTGQLGDYYLNRSGMVDMPQEWKAGIDTAQFGRHIAQQEQGAFTEYGYIVKSGDKWQRVHEGQPVPEEYRVMAFPQPEVMRDEIKTRQAAVLTAEAPQFQPVIPIDLNGKNNAERMKEITDRLEAGIQALFESEQYKAYLTAMSKFHNYSFNNTLLIAMQRPDATLVTGYRNWQSMGRQVKKGEKGITIIAPAPIKRKKEQAVLDQEQKPVIGPDGKPKTEEVEVTLPCFKAITVFDIEQTTGEPIRTLAPEILTAAVEDFDLFLQAIREISPVPIRFDAIEGSANGYYHNLDKEIVIKKDMSQSQTLKTAIHETAHARLHDKEIMESQGIEKDRLTKEVEAESVAYCVCSVFELDTSEYSFPYIAGWSSGKELRELKASMDVIRKTAGEIIDELTEKIEMMLEQKQEKLIAAVEAAGYRFAKEESNSQHLQFIPDGTHRMQGHLFAKSWNEVERWVEAIIEKGDPIQKERVERVIYPERFEQSFEEMMFTRKECRLSIYHLDENGSGRDQLFVGMEDLQKKGIMVTADQYRCVYSSLYLPNEDMNAIYSIFNDDPPADYKAHSLSVSDVVIMNQNGDMKAYFVDRFGFQELTDFVEERKKILGMENDIQKRDILEQTSCISFYAAECSEFPVLGEVHHDLNLPDALEAYEKIPAERMNGLKSVGFNLQEGSDYDGMMDLMVAGRSQREILDSIPFYKENKLVQEALKRVEQYIEEKSLNVEKTRPKEEKGEIQKTKSQKRREDMSL